MSIPPHAARVATSEQMRDFDRRAEQEFGVSSIVLMENAGRHIAQSASDLMGGSQGRRVSIVCGRGNNGGDGFVAARHLRDAGGDVHVYVLGAPSGIKGDAKINLDILLSTGFDVNPIESADDIREDLRHSDVIIDAIFGTGLRGEVRDLPADVIAAVNTSGRPVVAVDVPSGLDADTGGILGDCVDADCTVTFALPKIGLLTYPGASRVGRLVVVDIGIPRSLYDEVDVELPLEEWVASCLPERPADGHKGTFGSVLVIAGSAGMTGAAAMAGESALRTGTGLCTVAVPSSLQDIMAGKLTEVMTRALPETDARSISAEALESALELSEKADAVVLGCGIGTHPDTCRFVLDFIRSCRKPLVLDADALNCLAEDSSVLEGEHGDLIITPHPGEMSRLLGTSTAEVQSKRLETAREAASRFHCTTVLKGARTLISSPDGRVFVNVTGNSGMATGGTGDVLAGIIGGLLAQGLSPADAAACGTFIHGLAGDLAASEVGEAGMIAGDVIRSLPAALKELYGLRAARSSR